jgi:hypothetical protein
MLIDLETLLVPDVNYQKVEAENIHQVQQKKVSAIRFYAPLFCPPNLIYAIAVNC